MSAAVIAIVDSRRAETHYVTTRSAGHLHVGWTSSYRAAARFADDEIEEEIAFWQALLDDPGIRVVAVC